MTKSITASFNITGMHCSNGRGVQNMTTQKKREMTQEILKVTKLLNK